MKKILFLNIALILTLLVNAHIRLKPPEIVKQKNYYKLGDDSLYNEKSFKSIFEAVAKNPRENYILVPTIFHKIVKKDSVINYAIFRGKKKESASDVSKFEPVFEQDPLYLLLDQKLPEFKLTDLKGKTFNSLELMGKPTMINFWNLNCGPCIAEFPMLNQLKDNYGDKINFIAITDDNISDDGPMNRLKRLFNMKPFSFYQLQNGGDYKSLLKISSLPRNIFIDKSGIIRDIQGGLPFIKDSKTGKSAIQSNKPFEKIIERLIKL